MRKAILVMLTCLATSVFGQIDSLQNKMLSVAQIREDFAYYRKLLQETHPGLYRYTPQELMQAKLDSIDRNLDKPLSHYDFFKVISALAAEVRCAHTNALPSPDFRKHLTTIKTLPFFLYPIQGKLFVVFNGSTDQTVSLGYELLKINGHAVSEVINILKRHYWADGYSELPKNAVLQGSLFSYFYYVLIEQTDQFNLVFRDPQGTELGITVPAQNYPQSEKLFIKSPVNKKAVSLYSRNFKTPWRLSFLEDVPSTAHLRFDGFGAKGINSVEDARAAIQKFMNESLKKIEKKQSKNLIIDLRDNPGGWDVIGIELLSYLVKDDKPFRYYQHAFAVTDDSEFLTYSDLSEEDRKTAKQELQKQPDGTFAMREDQSPELQLQQPKVNRFKGTIYILMNERTASAAAEFAALCRSNDVGILVGSEAGGAYEGGNGSSFIHLNLPNSKIRVGTPLVSYQNAVVPTNVKGRGAMPHHFVSMAPEDLLTRFDRPLALIKDLINNTHRE